LRKRAQVEAFHHLVSTLLDAKLQKVDDNISSNEEMDGGVTIIDAGCGAGNLAISLAGIPYSSNMTVNVLAVDVNDKVLDRLTKRAQFKLLSGSCIVGYGLRYNTTLY
jgi:2-polyprenyl-3-methyl-5-hydroxy-6-metoxy-1,4-benzoquinol methylase